VTILSDALTAVFEDSDFMAEVETAGLVPAHLDASETQAVFDNTFTATEEYKDLLTEALSEG
jgi:hypothetical protein